MERDNTVGYWVNARISALAPTEWQPSTNAAWIRLQERTAPRNRAWWAAALATAALSVAAFTLPATRGLAQRLWESVILSRVEVVEVNPESMESLSPSVTSNSGPVRTAADSAEASGLAGFVPVLPPAAFGTPRLSVSGALQARLILRKEALERDLRRARAWDVDVPRAWDGLVVAASISPIVIADYGDWTLTQSTHITMTVPPQIALRDFGEVVFRVLGNEKEEAAALADKFARNPAWFLAIPREERAGLRQVRLKNGEAMWIEEKGDSAAADRITLLWSTQDRVLALSGRDEFHLIRVADSLQ